MEHRCACACRSTNKQPQLRLPPQIAMARAVAAQEVKKICGGRRLSSDAIGVTFDVPLPPPCRLETSRRMGTRVLSRRALVSPATSANNPVCRATASRHRGSCGRRRGGTGSWALEPEGEEGREPPRPGGPWTNVFFLTKQTNVNPGLTYPIGRNNGRKIGVDGISIGYPYALFSLKVYTSFLKRKIILRY